MATVAVDDAIRRIIRAHGGTSTPREPRFSFLDYPQPGQTAELIGTREVRITDDRGTVICT